MRNESPMLQTELSDEDFRKFQEFFYRKTGIQFDSSKRYFVDKRLLERIAATNSPTLCPIMASGRIPHRIKSLAIATSMTRS